MNGRRAQIETLIRAGERGQRGNRWIAAAKPKTLSWELDRRIKDGDNIRSVLAFFPIRAVTAIEVFFRFAIADLLDSNCAKSDGIEQLSRSLKFDYSLVEALVGKKFTMGELFGYSAALQRLESIISTMNAVTGIDFKKGVANARDRWEVEIERKHNNPIISDIEKVFGDVARLLEVRHVVVHELPFEEPFSVEDVAHYLDSTALFLDASNWFVSEFIEPGAPLQQSSMTEAAWNRASAADAELQAALNIVAPLVGDERAKLLEKSQDAWSEFRKLEVEFHASEFEGGSIAPQISAMVYESVTKERFADLRRLIDRIEHDRK